MFTFVEKFTYYYQKNFTLQKLLKIDTWSNILDAIGLQLSIFFYFIMVNQPVQMMNCPGQIFLIKRFYRLSRINRQRILEFLKYTSDTGFTFLAIKIIPLIADLLSAQRILFTEQHRVYTSISEFKSRIYSCNDNVLYVSQILYCRMNKLLYKRYDVESDFTTSVSMNQQLEIKLTPIILST